MKTPGSLYCNAADAPRGASEVDVVGAPHPLCPIRGGVCRHAVQIILQPPGLGRECAGGSGGGGLHQCLGVGWRNSTPFIRG